MWPVRKEASTDVDLIEITVPERRELAKHERFEEYMLGHIADVVDAIGTIVSRMDRRERKLMASLDALAAALEDLKTDVDTAAADVAAKIADLKAQIEALTAGSVTQEQIDALAAKTAEIDAAVTALDVSTADA